MELYAGIDLHSNNSVVLVLDENDRVVYQKRLPNSLERIIQALAGCAAPIKGVAVESTFNWYWLVDGLQAAGYVVHLVNTAAVKQYDGLKRSGDFEDAHHLAHLLRLGILPTGYIYPRQERALRDLLRKRSQMVRTRTAQILSMQNLLARNLGTQTSANQLKRWDDAAIGALNFLPEQKLAIKANLAGLQKQVAFAASKALNATGKSIADAMPAEIERVIDNPPGQAISHGDVVRFIPFSELMS